MINFDSPIQDGRKFTKIPPSNCREEYLLELRVMHVHKENKTKPVVPNVGDIVHIYERNQKRNKWRLGKISNLLKGKDDLVRGAEVELPEKNKKKLIISRPLNQLYPLEICKKDDVNPELNANDEHLNSTDGNEDDKDAEILNDSNIPVDDENHSNNRRDNRVRRAAAIDADWRRRMVQQLLNSQARSQGGSTGRSTHLRPINALFGKYILYQLYD